MLYTPKTNPVHAFQYGCDNVPKWLKTAAKLEALHDDGNRPYLLVTPTPDVNLTGPVCVCAGEYIVLQPNGGLGFYQTLDQFLYLLFDKTPED